MRGEYTPERVCLRRVSNSQPPGHESDTLTTEPPGWGTKDLIISEISLRAKKEPDNTFNLFQNKPWFSPICSTSLLKTLWEKEKLLVKSNFSFSLSVSTFWDTFLLISSNLKLSSANSFSLEESKTYRFGKELRPFSLIHTARVKSSLSQLDML